MDKQAILDRLKANERELRERGVAHAAVFGSRARGDHRRDSDIDILVDFADDARLTIFDYVGLKGYIAELFAEPVDVVNVGGLKPYIRAATAEAVYAF